MKDWYGMDGITWDEAFELAKEELGYSQDWNKVSERAKEIIRKFYSDIARENHKEYINSDEWKKLREEILKRDGYECQDCKRTFNAMLPDLQDFYKNIIYEPIIIKYPACQVHHITYEYIHTPEEAKFCISLCEGCHELRHTKISSMILSKRHKRYDKLFWIYYNKIISQDLYVKEAQKQHEDFIKSITIKPEQLEPF